MAEEVASRQVSRDQYRGSVERVWSASLAEDEQAFCAACERRAAVPPPAGTGEAPEGAGAVAMQERSGEGGEASVQEPSSERSDTPLASVRQAATHQRQGGADTAVTSLREALRERLRLTRSLRLRPVPCVPSPRFLTQVCAVFFVFGSARVAPPASRWCRCLCPFVSVFARAVRCARSSLSAC